MRFHAGLRYYAGGDGLKENAWSHAALILDSPGKLGMNGMVYIPEVQRYMMIGWYYPAGGP